MGIVYLVSVLLLFMGFILIKKSDKVLDIISFVGITITVLLAYNAFVCYVITFVSIPNTLLNLSIVNVIFSTIMFYIIIKNKEIQKYKLDKFGLLSVIIIFIAVIFVSYLNFGFPFNIKYETGDPATHYQSAVLFSKEDTLLANSKTGEGQTMKFGSYVNSGIIMECFSSFMDTMEFYKIFIVFSIFVLFMTGMVMYSTLEKFAKSRWGKILALVVSLIYTMGYPLNSFLFGFEYLSLGILILGTILHLVYYFENEELKFPFYVIIFTLLNFDVFCSYYMFVPFTYSALWIYFCIYSKNHYKKIICKKNVIMLTVTLLIPFFLGYIYHLAPNIYNIFHIHKGTGEVLDYSSQILGNSFSAYGYIYVNYYSNTLLLLPLVIYYIFKKKKEKDIFSYDIINLVLLLLYIGLLLIGEKLEKVSEYYLMKNYYALWLMLIYMNFRSLIYILNKSRIKTVIMTGFYVIVILIKLVMFDAPIDSEPGNPNENPLNLVEIFEVNKTIIKTGEIDLNLGEIEILKYVRDNLDLENDEIEFIADPEQMFWEYSFLRYINHETGKKYVIVGQHELTKKAMNSFRKIGKVDYIVYFKSGIIYNIVEPLLFNDGEIVFENESGGIIKYSK